MLKRVFFDLDGTLTDSSTGIINSFIYAFEKLNITPPSKSELSVIIGPPLRDSFLRFGVNENLVEKAVSIYRERYKAIGIYENKLYLGVENMLKSLFDSGVEIYLATSKPTDQAVTVLTHFNVIKYFKFVAGATYDGTRDSKISVLKYLIETIGENENAVMVGDTTHDVNAAKELGVKAVAVLYGFGKESELFSSNPIYAAKTVSKLQEFLLNYN